MLGCSARKVKTPGLLPAIERYDGPVYRIIRAHKAAGHRLPAILILSAKYGLIPSNHPIHFYDLEMTDRIAASLKNSTTRKDLRKAWWKAEDRFMICGTLYREVYHAMAPRYEDIVPIYMTEAIEPVYTAATGRIGEQLHQLKEWLKS